MSSREPRLAKQDANERIQRLQSMRMLQHRGLGISRSPPARTIQSQESKKSSSQSSVKNSTASSSKRPIETRHRVKVERKQPRSQTVTVELPGAQESQSKVQKEQKKEESPKRIERVLPPAINPNKRSYKAPNISPILPPVKPLTRAQLNDIDDDQEDETEDRIPEKIIDATRHKHRTYYLVKYRKVSLKHCTWLTQEDIPDAERLVDQFYDSVHKERIILGKGRFAYKRAVRRAFRVGELMDQKVHSFDNDGKSINLEPTSNDLSRTPTTPLTEVEAESARRAYYPLMNTPFNHLMAYPNQQFNPSHFPTASVNTMQIQQHQQNIQEGGRNFQPPLNQPLLLQKRTPLPNSYFIQNLQGPAQPMPQQQVLPQYFVKESSLQENHPSEKEAKEEQKIEPAEDIEIKLEEDEKLERQGQFSRGDIPLKIKGIGLMEQGKIYVMVEWHQRDSEECKIMPTRYQYDRYPPAGYKPLIDFLVQKIKFPDKKQS